ncbi:hypothetical protein Pcinc_039940 [Petrolisthes cinctipes]|uniref:Uncharacterized protein n=1 Tax=Petrolisthes cinctipes TaxID=88211 RepID=A0AAE1EJ11_PETCI|nr:hypothetical protein Pcinc_039940 [Petrolisthes cinctipes]
MQESDAGQRRRTTRWDDKAGQRGRTGRQGNEAGQEDRTMRQDSEAGQKDRTEGQDNDAGQRGKTEGQDRKEGHAAAECDSGGRGDVGERGTAGLLQVPGGGGVSRASGPVVAGGQTAGTHYTFAPTPVTYFTPDFHCLVSSTRLLLTTPVTYFTSDFHCLVTSR